MTLVWCGARYSEVGATLTFDDQAAADSWQEANPTGVIWAANVELAGEVVGDAA